MHDSGDRRLLLGAVGWPHPEWRGTYLPEDLPDDWAFAYFSNDLHALLLPFDDWDRLDRDTVAGWCEDAPEAFRFWLEWPDGVAPRDPGLPAVFGARLGGVLSAGANGPLGLPCWRPEGADRWRAADGRLLLRWRIGDDDLRARRARLERLDPAVCALCVADAEPGRILELRTLTELLGIA